MQAVRFVGVGRPAQIEDVPKPSPGPGQVLVAAAEVLQIYQPKVSPLVRGRLAGFSLDRLVRFLVLLGSDVEIVVKPRVRAAGRAQVMVA